MNDTEALIERLRSTDEERLNMEPFSCEQDMKAAANALDELREVLVEAAIPLEAMRMVGNDRLKMSPELWSSVENAVATIRAKLSQEGGE